MEQRYNRSNNIVDEIIVGIAIIITMPIWGIPVGIAFFIFFLLYCIFWIVLIPINVVYQLASLFFDLPERKLAYALVGKYVGQKYQRIKSMF
jgi:hypothetical protein